MRAASDGLDRVSGNCQYINDQLPAAAGRLAQAHLWWSEAQSKHGNLLNGPQDEAAAHMAASLRPPGSHPIRVAAWHLELLSGGQGRDEDLTASG